MGDVVPLTAALRMAALRIEQARTLLDRTPDNLRDEDNSAYAGDFWIAMPGIEDALAAIKRMYERLEAQGAE